MENVEMNLIVCFEAHFANWYFIISYENALRRMLESLVDDSST